MNSKIRQYIGYAVVILFGSIIAVYLFYNHVKSPVTSSSPIPEVTLLRVISEDLAITFDYMGRVVGSREVDIISQVDGIIVEQIYKDGQFVNKGDILFKINPNPFKADLAKFKAHLDNAQSDFKRAKSLYDKKFMSIKDYQSAKSKLDEAKSDFDISNIKLNYTTIKAPIAGFTSKSSVSVGELSRANTTVLTRIAQTDPIYIDFAYSEDEALRNRIGISSGKILIPKDGILKAAVLLENNFIIPEGGTVNFNDNMIDLKTASLSSRVIINNSNHLLIPGQFVRILIKGFIYKNAIAVPDQAIQQNAVGTYVYTVDDHQQIIIKPVKLGLLKNSIRIIEQGLKSGDLVIIEGMIKAKPQQKVNFKSNDIRRLNKADLISYNTINHIK